MKSTPLLISSCRMNTHHFLPNSADRKIEGGADITNWMRQAYSTNEAGPYSLYIEELVGAADISIIGLSL